MARTLKKELSLTTAILYGVGIILGAGIYVLIGQAAGIAGNAVWLSFVIGSVLAILTGLSYAELAGMFPKDAAEYVYTEKAFGIRILSFLTQWLMLVTLIVSAATVALGFGSYFSFLTGISALKAAVLLVVLLSFVSFWGMKESATFNVVGSIIETAGLLLVVIIGFFFVDARAINFFSSPAGFQSILSATTLIFFAYIGFEELVNLSEETKNARNVIPKALIIAVGISTLLYVLVSIAAINILGVEKLAASPAPLVEAVSSVIPNGRLLMGIIALFATSNTVLAILVVASRMVYGLARNQTIPGILGKIGERRTPYISIAAVMTICAAFLFVKNIKTIALLTDIGIFLVYFLVNLSLIRLRYRRPLTPRTFVSPLRIGRMPLLALLGCAVSLFMLFHFEAKYFAYELGLVGIGLAVYALFSSGKNKHG